MIMLYTYCRMQNLLYIHDGIYVGLGSASGGSELCTVKPTCSHIVYAVERTSKI